MKKFFAAALLSFMFCFSSYGQDYIHLKNGKVHEVDLIEVGVLEVKFKKLKGNTRVIYSVLKADIAKIQYDDGEVDVIVNDLENPDIYASNRKLAIKMDFISPLVGNTVLLVEKSVKPGVSLEGGLNLIGVGKVRGGRDSKGIGFRFAPKFIHSPDFYTNGLRYMHVLQGMYVKPELIIGFYKDSDSYEPYYSYDTNTESKYSYGIFSINIGKQWVFQNIFLIDVFGGVGYGFASGGADRIYHYGYLGTSDSFELAFTGGMRFGFLLK